MHIYVTLYGPGIYIKILHSISRVIKLVKQFNFILIEIRVLKKEWRVKEANERYTFWQSNNFIQRK